MPRACQQTALGLALGLTVAGFAVHGVPAAAEVTVDSNTFGALRARNIGPAAMSGRIAAIAGVAGSPHTLYAGAASGGLWKSVDGGVRWKPVFDDHVQSIGAVAVDPTTAHDDPEELGPTVWVGTGETWTRNSVSVGDGVYKTVDGGATWKHMGLADTERVARILVHPADADIVYVCATGHLWDANEERGVYKTADGGETWERVLYVNADTGCSDLAMDPEEPERLYAGLWEFRRAPDFFESGGAGSGLYRSTDGGAHWQEVREGLPEGHLGRIAVAVAPSRPSTLYAVVEAEKTAIYRSDDLGQSWQAVHHGDAAAARPFYFAALQVDPRDHRVVYKEGYQLTRSDDAGKSFLPISGGTHGDHHALWINPDDPSELVAGSDGGLYLSRSRGGTWIFLDSMALGQFYQVGYDREFPYHVMGGLQDNGTWHGPSYFPGGILNENWDFVFGGDGFHAYPAQDDWQTVFVEYQGGNVQRVDLRTHETKSIRPYKDDTTEDLRFNWNTPIHMSPTRAGTLYVGAQYLYRSRDRGDSWERISNDLTTDDPERQRQLQSGGLTIDNSTAENNATLFTISESVLDDDVVWAGTDDGRLWVTQSGGGLGEGDWQERTVPGVPAGTWISQVEAGHHDKAVAYVTFDGHRSGDMNAYVYRTRDFGATFERLGEGQIEGFAHVVREDLVDPELLFVGTEFGLYISIDGGAQWARFKGNLPQVPVHDLQVHPDAHDLIIATHGRSLYILDDLTPLRGLSAEALDAEVVLLPSRPAILTTPGGGRMAYGSRFYGENAPQAATITYYMRKRHLFGDLKIEVYDAAGELIKTLPGSKRRGINRVALPTRLPAPKVPPANNLVPAFEGPVLPEGTYTVKLIKGKETLEGTFELRADPRSPHSAEDRAVQQKTALQLYADLEDLTYVVDTLIDVRDQARERAGELGSKKGLGAEVEALADGLETLRGELVATSEGGRLSGEVRLREHLGELFGAVNGYWGRPSQSQLDRAAGLKAELDDATSRFEATLSGLDALNVKLEKKEVQPITRMTREAWEKKKEG